MILLDLTAITSIANLVSIGVKTLKIDSGRFLEKYFIGMMNVNPHIVLYLTVNSVDSSHNCVCGP